MSSRRAEAKSQAKAVVRFPSPLRGGVRGGGAPPEAATGFWDRLQDHSRGADTPIPNPFPARGKGLFSLARRTLRPASRGKNQLQSSA